MPSASATSVLAALLLLLLFSSAVYVGASSSSSSSTPMMSAALSAALSSSSAVTCAECEFVVGVVYALARDKRDAAAILRALDRDCERLFPSNDTATRVCLKVAAAVVAAVPGTVQWLSFLGWSEPRAFCAVFVPGTCSSPCCVHPTRPEQLHLSLVASNIGPGNNTVAAAAAAAAAAATNDDVATLMRVQWSTLERASAPSVEWWPADRSAPAQLASAAVRTLSNGGFRGWLHAATMHSLVPGVRYAYRVGDATSSSSERWSSVWNFTQLPADVGGAASGARALRVVQVADMGAEHFSNATVAALRREVDAGTLDVVLHVGDESYADGWSARWSEFFRKIEPIAARVPYQFAPGNHELVDDFALYRAHCTDWLAGEPMYYSLRIGGALHVALIDTESPIDTPAISTRQAAWLDDDLRAADTATRRRAQPFVVVAGHRPFYCAHPRSVQCTTFADYLRGVAEHTLLAHHVDVVVGGHVHDYSRTWPMAHGGVLPAINTTTHSPHTFASPVGAPVYAVNGAAGCREGIDTPSLPPFAVASFATTGYVRLRVEHGATLRWQFVNSTSGAVLDEFELVRSATPPSALASS